MQSQHKSTRKRRASKKRTNVRRCSIAIRGIPPSCYRLPNDGRQWESQCRLRRELAQLLASYANPDGTHIAISVATMAAALEKSRSVVFELLDDLRALGYLHDGAKSGFRGTTWRTLNVSAMLDTLNCGDTTDSIVRNSQPNSPELPAQPSGTYNSTVRKSPANSPELTSQPSGTGREFRIGPCFTESHTEETENLTEPNRKANREHTQGSAPPKNGSAGIETFFSSDDEENEVIPSKSLKTLQGTLKRLSLDPTDKRNLGALRGLWKRTSNSLSDDQRVRRIREALEVSADGREAANVFGEACRILEGW